MLTNGMFMAYIIIGGIIILLIFYFIKLKPRRDPGYNSIDSSPKARKKDIITLHNLLTQCLYKFQQSDSFHEKWSLLDEAEKYAQLIHTKDPDEKFFPEEMDFYKTIMERISELKKQIIKNRVDILLEHHNQVLQSENDVNLIELISESEKKIHQIDIDTDYYSNYPEISIHKLNQYNLKEN